MTGLGFPGDSAGKESACNEGDLSSIPGLGRSPGGGHDNPLQFSGLQSTMDRGAWQATVHGITNSRTWLSGFHFHTFFFHNWLRVWMPPTPPTITYTHTHTHTHTIATVLFKSRKEDMTDQWPLLGLCLWLTLNPLPHVIRVSLTHLWWWLTMKVPWSMFLFLPRTLSSLWHNVGTSREIGNVSILPLIVQQCSGADTSLWDSPWPWWCAARLEKPWISRVFHDSCFSSKDHCLVIAFSTLYVPHCSCTRERRGALDSSETPYSWANLSPLPQCIPFLPALTVQLFSCPRCFSSSEILPQLLVLPLRHEIRKCFFFFFVLHSIFWPLWSGL